MKQFAVSAAILTFTRAVENGGFAAAARVLDLSPAAVGQSVRRLEEHFGVKLLNRTTRRMSLTPDGRRLMDRSGALLSEIEEIGRIFEESRGIVSGPLRVSVPVGVARHQLMPLFADFALAHPAVHLDIDATDRVRDFAEGAIDVGFRILLPNDSSLIARPIARIQAVTVASPAYLRERGTPAHPKDLLGHRCIGYRFPGSGNLAEQHFRIAGKTVSQHFTPSLTINDIEVGCEAAARGLGIVQPPSNYLGPYIEDGRLVPVLSKFTATPWTLYLCYPDREKLPLRVRRFIDFALQRLKREAFAAR